MTIWTFQGHMGFTYKLQTAITRDHEGSPRIPQLIAETLPQNTKHMDPISSDPLQKSLEEKKDITKSTKS